MPRRPSMLTSLNLPPVEGTDPNIPRQSSRPAAVATRRGNPAYRQFSAYVPDPLYRKFKSKLALDNRDLSEVMEELISTWVDR